MLVLPCNSTTNQVKIHSVKPIKHINKNWVSPFIFSFRVKLPWIFFSSASMVSPPISASRWVRFTMPIPNTMSVTCWGSELTRLRRRPPAPRGLFGVAGSCCSFSKMTLQSGSEGRRPPSAVHIWKIFSVKYTSNVNHCRWKVGKTKDC